MPQLVCCYVPCTYVVGYNNNTVTTSNSNNCSNSVQQLQLLHNGSQSPPSCVYAPCTPLTTDVSYTQPPVTPTSGSSTNSSTFHVHNPYSMTCIEQYSSTSSVTADSVDEDSTASLFDYEETEQDQDDKRNKRRRRRASPVDDNAALDALRYKTKMCKNWEVTGKCPYGPRCLFAHGKRELRSYSENNQAIVTAARTQSPERQFFAIGRFPQFIPVPTDLLKLAATTA